ncbi:dipeptide/oligopeptide/nickel ABC transporter permease/ATP-binding protein [Streptomyces sp. Ag109_O5-1]|uniref:dipeptide/oligopeptide/nickel ABC transporter permease/ATP-binding protein n=1 Tax=Streptomyces sp. Ag109_O5-1 TaxID=1938851 RepID=UPI000F50435D|nr:dipeptide/oligopeptide/nickel ABC transporter permease/ATP-binding protein [Streptomyces sp. Ag109_O5-1]
MNTPAPARTRPAPRRGGGWLAVLRTPVGAAAGLLLGAVLVLAVIAPPLWHDQAATINTGDLLKGASSAHWAGTDNLGRDLFLRVLVATRLSVGLALLAMLVAVVAGLLLGTAAVVVGRRAARLIAAVVDIAVAFPGLLLALFFAVIFGVGTTGAVLAIGCATAPGFARLTQTLVAGVVARDYVAAARIAGVGRIRLLTRHVLPNIAEPLVVNATIGAGSALLSFAALSFLGLGVQGASYDWGRLLGEGLDGIYVHPAAALAPGVAVIVAGLAFNLFGEAVAKRIGLTGTGQPPSRGRAARPGAAPTARTSAEASTDVVLDVRDLTVTVTGPDGPVRPVRGVGFRLLRGEAVGIVGESGSGKSMTVLAVAGLLDERLQVDADRLTFLGTDLLSGSPRDHARLLGSSFAMVFQDPMTSFNPALRVGSQLAEVSRRHGGLNRRDAAARAVDRLRAVRIPAAERRAYQYPHEFSGGMRQRAMIGMGMMGSPALIVADEPTTALDVTVQRQVLRLIDSVRRSAAVATLLISHDVTVVGQVCDRVLVMYAGRIVEELPASELATKARHPYTRALVAAVPDMRSDPHRPLPVIPGRLPDPSELPVGCAFAPRCSLADDRCHRHEPPLETDADGRRVACWQADAEPRRGSDFDSRADVTPPSAHKTDARTHSAADAPAAPTGERP